MSEIQENNIVESFDSPWKDVLEQFFPEFMLFFFPKAHAEINWSHPLKFLDKEFQQIFQEAPKGRQIVDKLLEVVLSNGQPSLVLVHIEIQAQKETEFAKRIFMYNYRIHERYLEPVASFAVLADEQPTWKPDQFGYNILGCQMGIIFPSVKILDYRDRWEELEESENPFAVVVMAHLKTLETKKDFNNRYQWKLRLARMLYKKGYNREQIIGLLRFIDGGMQLPKELENQFWEEIRRDEKVKNMPYVMSIEKIAEERGIEKGFEEGIEKGIEEGIEKGEHKGLKQGIYESIVEILEIRFSHVPQFLIDKLDAIDDIQTLKNLHHKAMTVATVEEFHNQF